MNSTPQDLAYTRIVIRYDEALERISVLSREKIALERSVEDLRAEIEALKAIQKGRDDQT